MKTEVLTPFVCGAVTELFSKDKANRYFEEGKVVFFAGGTGHPYFSTDTGITLRAVEMDADVFLFMKGRPTVYMTATRLRTRMQKLMTPSAFQEVIDKKLAVVDLTASIMCNGK